MTTQDAHRTIVRMLEDENVNMYDVMNLAWEHDITLTEIWSDDDEEIIGMMVEDDYILY